METKKKIYYTEQRKQLMDFLKANKSKQYTIDEIIEHMHHMWEDAPGKSTVYRLMKQLVEEGKVKRCNRGNSRQFMYQLLDGATCSQHFHLQCEACGKLIHLEVEQTKKIEVFLEQQEEFYVDIGKCTLFGVCTACKEEK